ncbi:hypothetical protein DFH07DRAFT_865056 [Mycena maculata]|uniref:Uncharacterized protein n=1 Tax=Mycena maculata TaxID=230809 RepID=A0AAD7KAW9_9AGAR|nr:hypothetical protein DFH07DRAFT_865056 [Mycena maculata]
MSSLTSVILPDKATIAYEVLGSHFMGHALSLVMVFGMSTTRNDWRALSPCLPKSRPDYDGIPGDLVLLIAYLRWSEVAICGFSMGGRSFRQTVLPYLESHPTPLPTRVTHVFLAGTRSAVLRDPQHGLQIRPTNRKYLIRRTLQATFDPSWLLQDLITSCTTLYTDGAFIDVFATIQELTYLPGSPRPPASIGCNMIEKQRKALQRFDFEQLLPNISSNIQILVIHGQQDQVILFRCAEIGNQPGKVPSLAFGHQWFEYFDLGV